VDRVRGLANLPEDFDLRFFFAKEARRIVRLAEEHRVDRSSFLGTSLEPERAATLKAVIRDAPCGADPALQQDTAAACLEDVGIQPPGMAL
jgi:hypothetical protein